MVVLPVEVLLMPYKKQVVVVTPLTPTLTALALAVPMLLPATVKPPEPLTIIPLKV